MHFLYEEGGEVKVASLLGSAPAASESWQVETLFGKRIKLKAKDVWMTFKDVEPRELLSEASEIAKLVDMDLLWECSPDTEFKFDQIAREYFGDAVSTTQLIALAIALQAAPIYFRRKGRGQFQRAPQEQLQAALLAVERKKAEGLQQSEWEQELLEGKMPEILRSMTAQLLYSPDKNGIHYKALNSASQKLSISIPALLLKVGAIASPLAIHQGHFLKEHFPKGVGFEDVISLAKKESVTLSDLTTANVKAFSIDDALTTEIDDAFSVTEVAGGYFQVGIHIAAPALGISRGDSLDQVARKRLSTVYFPGGKITMLPSTLVEQYSLTVGHDPKELVSRPALSLYVYIDSQGKISDLEEHLAHTKVELVPIAANLRLHEFEDRVTQESLDDESNKNNIPYQLELAALWKAAKVFHANRQLKRVEFGQRPEVMGVHDPKALLRDFNFEVSRNGLNILDEANASVNPLSNTVDDRDWTIQIKPRQRGSVVDSIVAEWMIFCNSTWGSMLAAQDVPAIYRAQQGWGAQRTRMQTAPCRHEGLGVENYAWCTSPLRRYSDLVNQWQLIALAKHGVTAKLAAPFAPKDSELFAIAADFDATYGAYGEYQNLLEKYWCLRWVAQQDLPVKVRVRTLKEGQVRLELVPLRLYIPELAEKPRGIEVDIEIIAIDLLELSASVRVIEIFEPLDSATDMAD
jgi:exoribonuclease-2